MAVMTENVTFTDPATYTKTYAAFRGVDYATDETQIDDTRSPEAINLISDSGGYPALRLGWRTLVKVSETEKINGAFAFDNGVKKEVVIHCGSGMYLYTLTDPEREAGTLVHADITVTDGKSTAFRYGNFLYILTGGEYLYYNGEKFDRVTNIAYVPTTSISREPDGGGSAYQGANRLSRWRKNTFIPDGTTKMFRLDGYPLDETGELVVTDNGTVVKSSLYSVDREKGIVKFSTAPAAPSNPGVATLEIKFPKTPEGFGNIDRCSVYGLYGYRSDNRVFLAGDPENPATEYYSALNDPTYFPDLNYNILGSASFPIVGFSKAGGEIAVIKKDNEQEGTVWYHTAEYDSTEGAVFPIREGISGVGGIGGRTSANLLDDPLFLSPSGVLAPVANYSYAKYQRYVINRSERINPRLLKEKNLEEAVAAVWKGLYVLCLNGHAYVADGVQGRTDKGYEWYYWENIPARCLTTFDDVLYFGTEDGRLCRFNDDKVNKDGDLRMEAYNDDGEGIPWEWRTKLDDDGDFMSYKTMPKRGSGLHVKAYTRSSCDVYIRRENDWGKLKRQVTADMFDFRDLDFTRFTFNTTKNVIHPFRSKVKKYKAIQVILKGVAKNEGFGVYGITRRYRLGKYVKK